MRPSGEEFSARAQCVSAGFRPVVSEAERGEGAREAEERKYLPEGGAGGRKWESEFPSGVKGTGEKLLRENVETQGTRNKVPASREVDECCSRGKCRCGEVGSLVSEPKLIF